MQDPTPSSLDRTYPAKYAIIFVFGLSIIATMGSWLYMVNVQRKPIALWGADHAVVIVRGPRAEAIKLAPGAGDDPQQARFEVEGRTWHAVEVRDIVKAPGLNNVRNCMINERSFDNQQVTDIGEASWAYALRFADEQKQSTLLIDPAHNFARLYETGATASIKPVISVVKGFMEEVLAPREDKKAAAR